MDLPFLGGCTDLLDCLDFGLEGGVLGLVLTLGIFSPLLGSGWSPGHLLALFFHS